MQLSSGIPGAFSYVCWQFKSGMMLCGCQVAFLWRLAPWAGNFRSGKMLCGWCMAFLWQSAMWAGNLDRAWCYVAVSGSCAAFSYACGLAT